MASWFDRVLKPLGLQRAFNPFLPGELERILAGGYYPQMTMGNAKQEPIGVGFTNFVTQAYAQNPIVFACENARSQLFSEARFQFQKLKEGRPGELFNGPSTYLRLLEHPWPGGTTSALLKSTLVDADFAGTGFIVRDQGMLQRLRPDWVTIISGNPRSDATIWDHDTEILGIGYQPDGPTKNREKVFFQRSQVAIFAPIPDPLRRFSGMPWLMSALKEINADQDATYHKTMFWQNAATPNIAVMFDKVMSAQAAKQWIDLFHADHEGAANAYKTLFLGGGATMQSVGANLHDADFSKVTSAGELRIASAAGVPPIIIGLAGGLDAATYSNYGQARRAFADLTMRPLWRDMAGALESIISIPEDSRLWYDDRDISFLQEDVKDLAEIQSTQSAAIRQLVDAGFDPDTIISAIMADDFSRLKHSGLYSVQLQPPMPEGPPEPKPLAPNEIPDPQSKTEPARAWVDVEVRCSNCDRLVGKRTAPGGGFEVKCERCKNLVTA